MNEETLKQLEDLKKHPKYQSCFFYYSLNIIVIDILPCLTPEEKEILNFDSLFGYITNDGGINANKLIEDLKFIGVESSLIVEISESIFEKFDFYIECLLDG